MLKDLLNSPEVTTLLTTVILGVVYALIGSLGRALEAEGAKRSILALVVIGKRLEAIGYDGDKLKGKPGANERLVEQAESEKGRP
jgi:hypothetical protein